MTRQTWLCILGLHRWVTAFGPPTIYQQACAH